MLIEQTTLREQHMVDMWETLDEIALHERVTRRACEQIREDYDAV